MLEEYTNPEATEEIDEDGSDLFDEGDDLFEDDETAEDETAETEEDEQTSEPETVEQKKEPDAAGKIRVKYNGEDRELTMEEAVAYAQKGMNYDKVVAERDRLRPGEKALQVLGKFAEMNGMSVEQYTEFLEGQQKAVTVQREIESIRAKHPDVSDDLAREIAEMRAEARRKETEEREAARRRSEEEANQKPWRDFVREYPEMKDITKLPEDVIKGIQDGLTPVEAMLRHERAERDKKIEELTAKLETKDKNRKNKEKAIGSAASSAGGGEKDPFLEGLGF